MRVSLKQLSEFRAYEPAYFGIGKSPAQSGKGRKGHYDITKGTGLGYENIFELSCHKCRIVSNNKLSGNNMTKKGKYI